MPPLVKAPMLPAFCPYGGVVGHNIDRCIMQSVLWLLLLFAGGHPLPAADTAER